MTEKSDSENGAKIEGAQGSEGEGLAEERTNNNSKSTGRGFSILGDSISTMAGWMPDQWRIFYEGEAHVEGVTTPDDLWWGQVINHFGGHLVSNSSFSGAVVEGFGFPAGNSEARVAALLGSDGEIPDVVLVFMGINDYGWGGGRNQVMGQSLSASGRPEDFDEPHEVADVVGPEALQLFRDAYAEMLHKIRRIAPLAEIWCVNLSPGSISEAPWPNFIYSIRGIELDEYNRAIASAAAQENAHVADVRAFGVNYDSIEGTHPTAIGMKQFSTMVISQMEGKSTNPDDYPLLAGLEKSQRACFKPNCAGCEFANVTPNRWTLYCSRDEPAK